MVDRKQRICNLALMHGIKYSGYDSSEKLIKNKHDIVWSMIDRRKEGVYRCFVPFLPGLQAVSDFDGFICAFAIEHK